MNVRLYRWIRDLHLYLGRFVSPSERDWMVTTVWVIGSRNGRPSELRFSAQDSPRAWYLSLEYGELMDTGETPAPIEALLDNHRAFLRYLERRVGNRMLAEDILQDAFAKVVSRPEQAPPDEAIVPWFYRTLRNAAVDQFRRRGAADRAYEAFARELETHEAPTGELEAEICACVSRLATTLKPEYADALQAIEVGGTPVKAFAEQHGLSPGNAAVRVFRAREALKKRVTESCGTCAEHGCVNCTCKRR